MAAGPAGWRARARAEAISRALAAAGAKAFDDRLPFEPDRLDRRDPAVIEALLPALEDLNRDWFRLRVEGAEHLPHGPARRGSDAGSVPGVPEPISGASAQGASAGAGRTS